MRKILLAVVVDDTAEVTDVADALRSAASDAANVIAARPHVSDLYGPDMGDAKGERWQCHVAPVLLLG
jgi:hypothetical protein